MHHADRCPFRCRDSAERTARAAGPGPSGGGVVGAATPPGRAPPPGRGSPARRRRAGGDGGDRPRTRARAAAPLAGPERWRPRLEVAALLLPFRFLGPPLRGGAPAFAREGFRATVPRAIAVREGDMLHVRFQL